MSSISVGELKDYLNELPDDYEVIMEIHHKYPISEEDGRKGWIAYINGIHEFPNYREIHLMN